MFPVDETLDFSVLIITRTLLTHRLIKVLLLSSGQVKYIAMIMRVWPAMIDTIVNIIHNALPNGSYFVIKRGFVRSLLIILSQVPLYAEYTE